MSNHDAQWGHKYRWDYEQVPGERRKVASHWPKDRLVVVYSLLSSAYSGIRRLWRAVDSHWRLFIKLTMGKR